MLNLFLNESQNVNPETIKLPGEDKGEAVTLA